jgi:hypothetical protein
MAGPMPIGRQTSRALLGIVVLGLCLSAPNATRAATGFGALTGNVRDSTGVPQMGASVSLIPEATGVPLSTQLFTNQKGAFSDLFVPPGLYEVRVTLAGFLPSVQHHVQVISNLNTLVKVELTTVFASLDRLRHGPGNTSDTSDDWKWVVRTSASTRPILQVIDNSGGTLAGTVDTAELHSSHAEIALTSGSDSPGSISNMPDVPASAFAYDQSLGSMGRLLLAAQMSYGREAYAPAMAAIWMPLGSNSTTTINVRQTPLGSEGFNFSGARLAQNNTAEIGDRMTLHYGAEAIVATLGRTAESLRPSADLDVRFSPEWTAHLLLASEPGYEAPPSSEALDAAISQLDVFPVMLMRDGHPVIAGDWHLEMGLSHKLGKRTIVEAAAYRDHSSDTAVFGSGNVSNSDFLEDPTSNAFAYDAGAFNAWGARIAVRQKLTNDLALAAVYAYAGALAPGDMDIQEQVRDALQMRYRQSVALRLAGRVSRTHTQFGASYKWIDGLALTRQDAFGETSYDIDPYLSLTLRQELPGGFFSGRWEAVAEVRNLLGQGYAVIPSADGPILLTAACRTFRGGLSFQF